jgi:hypothetical protein
MKRQYYILLAGCLLLSFSAHSQRFNGGMLLGIAGTQVAGDTYSGFHKAGLFAGGFVNLQISPRSIFQMELEFFMKGSRQNPQPDKNEYDVYIFRANYVEMPLLYQFVINEKFQVEVGPSLGFFTNYYEELNDQPITKNPPARVSYQINVGLYVALTQKLKVNIRTNNSFLNIRSDNATGDVYRIFDYGQYNDCLVLSLFYQFKNQSE